jgi:ribose 5-phosphate isomerase A
VTSVDLEREKRLAAETAAGMVEDGMTVGLGTGSSVAFFLPVLARREVDVVCIATSSRTELAARELGLNVVPFERLDGLDIAVDGADQIAPDGWLIKGGGAAHTREKIVAAAADRFIVIASSDKVVDELSPPVPLELLAFGLDSTLRVVAPAKLRHSPPSPDGGLIADYVGPIEDPATLAARLSAVPGVVEHGLFPPELIAEIVVARGDEITRRVLG